MGLPSLRAPWCGRGFKACWSPRPRPSGEAGIGSRGGRVWKGIVSGVRETEVQILPHTGSVLGNCLSEPQSPPL